MSESSEIPGENLDRQSKIDGIVQTWIDLVNETTIDEDTKSKVTVLVKDAGNLLGKGNTGFKWDKVAEKLQTISSVSQMLRKTESDNLTILIYELNLDMSRMSKEFLGQ